MGEYLECEEFLIPESVGLPLHGLGLRVCFLQWGAGFADRFSSQEADVVWERFKPVDDALQADEDQWAPGFQGDATRYYFNEIPAEVTAERFIAGWE